MRSRRSAGRRSRRSRRAAGSLGWPRGRRPPLLTSRLATSAATSRLAPVLLLYSSLLVVDRGRRRPVAGLVPAVSAFLLRNWLLHPAVPRRSPSPGPRTCSRSSCSSSSRAWPARSSTPPPARADAARARAEAETLAAVAANCSRTNHSRPGRAVRSTFGLDGVEVLRRRRGRAGPSSRRRVEAAGDARGADAHEPSPKTSCSRWRAARSPARSTRCRTPFAAQLAAARSSGFARPRRGAALAKANELRTALLQAVSHDLRTPLASIKAARRACGRPTSSGRPRTSDPRHHRGGDRPARAGWSTNLLDMSRLQAGALAPTLRPVGLEEVVPGALAGLGDARPAWTSTCPRRSRSVADPALLERVVANLVENAVRSSPGDTTVRVEAAGRGRVEVRVVDRGPGIPAATGAGVPAVPAAGRPDRRRGVGLGLAVARGFVKAMAGECDRGHTRRRDDHGHRACPRTVVKSVLVVDDEPRSSAPSIANLRARGYEVEPRVTGEYALEIAARHHPDVIVLDLGLPGIERDRRPPRLRGWTRCR